MTGRNFVSDNVAPAHPAIAAAIARADEGPAPSYGGDAISGRLDELVGRAFDAEVRVVPAASGTAANALALAALAGPGRAERRIFCHEAAHIRRSEEGAPEFHVDGAAWRPLPGGAAKVDPGALAQALDGKGGILSITQATERGAVYRPEEVRALTAPARAAGLGAHMDGARFANAAARLGCRPAALAGAAGIDALALGTSKNGTLNAEAVVFFDPARAAGIDPLRKRAGHLYSKMRYLSAQIEAWFADGLWLRLAARANDMADRLADRLAGLPGVALEAPVEANLVFVSMPETTADRLRGRGFAVAPRGPDGVVRLVASWATTEADVDALAAAARK